MKHPARQGLAILLASTVFCVHAAPTQAALNLTVNGKDKGVIPVLLTDAGEWFIGAPELSAVGITVVEAPSQVEGKAYYPLSRLNGVKTVINETDLTAILTAEASQLEKQVISLIPKPTSALTPPAKLSAYLNYQLGTYSEKDTGATANVDGGLRAKDWLLDGRAFIQQGNDAGLSKRLKLTRDWTDSMTRLEIGDLPAQSAVPGQSLAMRGVSVSRAFETQPYFQRTPGTNFSGSVGVPAQAEILVDGVLIRTVALDPGMFDINSLAYRTGLHNAVVIVRDRAGNILSTTGGPTYFSSQGLAKGITDYGFSLGRLTDGTQDGSAGFSGRYAKGVSDSLTLGVNVQGEGLQRYASAMSTLILGPAGTISGQGTKGLGSVGGTGLDINYGWQATHSAVSLSAQRYSKDFFGATALGAGVAPAQATAGSFSYSMLSGQAVSMALASRRYQDDTVARSVSVGYTARIRNMNFFAQIARVTGTATERGVTANLLVSWEFGDSRRAAAYVTKTPYGSTARVDTSRITSDEAGFGYQLSAQRDNPSYGTGYFEYGFKDAILASTVTANAQHSTASAFLTSSVAYVDGNFKTARRARDSFAIADVGLPNVRIRRNNELVGVTGADGKLFVPFLAPYAANQITLEEQDIPADYSLDQHMQVVTPARQAGLLVKFDLHPVRSAGGHFGTARVPQPNTPVALRTTQDVSTILTSTEGTKVMLTVRGDGTFYFDELLEGEWKGKFADKNGICNVRLLVPQRTEPYLDLGEIHCETP